MTTLNLPFIFMSLVGLVFPAIAMASLFLHVPKTGLFRSVETQSYPFFKKMWTCIITRISIY
ncbi:hypothetical protein R3W88_027155 [Solanum pinnatisectum]|uniref:Photosystem I reaction center subunit VIII n=1 Tax=Solanum pinnatisectum TaxID=50273 RepID=A0AAV9LF71_9SOLN|nr:hypothetical protein R3W88_027155 [Solanum pinnatisectum]